MSRRILVVEDEPTTAQLLKDGLTLAGFSVTTVKSAEEALAWLGSAAPELLILDINLPGISGFELCGILKKNPQTAGLPIVMLTSHGREADKVAGLRMGADDYMVKPFSEKELVARVEAVLRRAKGAAPEAMLQSGDILVNLDRREAAVKGKSVDLTLLEFDLLAFFLKHKGRAHTYQALGDAVWGDGRVAARHTVSVTISRLREKLGDAGSAIEPVPGVGYKFTE